MGNRIQQLSDELRAKGVKAKSDHELLITRRMELWLAMDRPADTFGITFTEFAGLPEKAVDIILASDKRRFFKGV